jgi:hypothetical protein
MTVSYGFYNSVNGDRTYNAETLSEMFVGVINDGIFESIENALEVYWISGMNVGVKKGRAWFDNSWTKNDAVLTLTLDASDPTLKRYDAIVLETNKDTRINSIKIVKGTPASSPSYPTLTATATVKQYALAYIYIAAGVTNVNGQITNNRGTVDCPYVLGILRNVDSVDLDALELAMSDLETFVSENVGILANKLKPIATTGSANAYIVTYSSDAPTSYTDLVALIKPNFTNTAGATININSLGVKTLKKQSTYGKSALEANDLTSGHFYILVYDGTDVIVLNATTSGVEGIQVFTSSGTFTAPKTGKYKVTVTGGGGNGGYYPTSGKASGGGFGGTAIKYVSLTKGDSVTVTIGAGGAAYSPSGGQNGNPGGTSSFGAHCSATGGSAGLWTNSTATGMFGGGVGGIGSGGDININGEYGAMYVIGYNYTGLAATGNFGSSNYGAGYPTWISSGQSGVCIVEW